MVFGKGDDDTVSSFALRSSSIAPPDCMRQERPWCNRLRAKGEGARAYACELGLAGLYSRQVLYLVSSLFDNACEFLFRFNCVLFRYWFSFIVSFHSEMMPF